MIKILRILFLLFLIGQSFSQTPMKINNQKAVTNLSGTQLQNGNTAPLLLKQNNQSFVTNEFLIDTNMVYIPQLREQEDPSIAFDGTNYLVVWSDYRSIGLPQSTYYDIYGTRVSPDGTVLDPGGIAICTAQSTQEYPKVEFNGVNYLVVWADKRNGVSGNYWDIYGARVSTAGNVLDPDGIAICTVSGDQRGVSIATDGSNFLVAWNDGRNDNSNPDIYGTRVDGGGNVLDTDGIAISTESGTQQRSSISFDGNNFMVVWEDGRTVANWSDIYCARVNTGGIVLDPAGIAIHTGLRSDWYPSIAFGGTNYFIAWCHQDSTITGSLLSPDGILIGAPVHIDDSPTPRFSRVIFNGTNFLISWEDIYLAQARLHCKRVSNEGNLIDSTAIVVSNACSRPAVAFDGTNHLAVWMDYRTELTTYSEIFGSRINQNGNVIDTSGFLISKYINPQNTPAVAFDGTNYLVVWQDYRNVTTTGYDIYGARVAPDGSILDPAGFVICNAESHQWQPSVAFDGTNYLVTWDDQRNFSHKIYGTRISTSGIVLDTAGIEISIGSGQKYNPALAFDGTNYFVVWEDGRDGTYDLDIYGTRVSQDGTVLDPDGINLFLSVFDQVKPDIAFDGTNYLVVWQDDLYENIDGVRVDTDGTVLDPSGIHISTANNYRYSPSVAFDGTNYLVIWEDWRNSEADIYAARVETDGTVIDDLGLAVCTETGDQTEVSIVFKNGHYFAAWMDYRNGDFSDIYGAEMDLNGSVLTSMTFSNQTGNQVAPVLVDGLNQYFMLAYSGYTDMNASQPVNSMRIWGNITDGTVGVNEDNKFQPVSDFNLEQNYPNPFNPSTKISWQSPENCRQTLKIYDILGNEVVNLVDEIRNAGKYSIDFNATGLSSGIYFYKLQAGNYFETRKMILLK